MELPTLLSTLRTREVKLWIDNGQLKCSAPVGALDADLRSALTSRKQEIIVFLHRANTLRRSPGSVVPIKPEGRRAPIFAVSGHGADVFCLLPLARQLHPEQPMVGIQPPGLDGTEPLNSIESLADHEIERIRQYRPGGPYLILGHCAGGTLAFEVAHRLKQSGEEVALLALIGSPFPKMFSKTSLLGVRISSYADALTPAGFAQRLRLRRERHKSEGLVTPAAHAARSRVEAATVAAVRNYTPRFFDGTIDLFITADRWHHAHLWRSFARNIREHDLRRFHVNQLLLGSDVTVLATLLAATLDQQRDAGLMLQRT
jgi:thioesterase domain-containing protein